MTEDKQAKKLEQVRALLAKAAGTQYPEEADAFRRKADAIMTAYAIDAWMVDQAQEGVDARPTPEIRSMDFSWWRNNPFKDQLWWMFNEVGTHCRCKAVTSKLEYDASGYLMPVIGLPSDLEWFDLLFTNLMIAMIQKVDPRPRSDLSVDENMAVMREAGLPWADALNRLALSGMVPSLAVEDAQRHLNETGEEKEFRDDDKFRYDGRATKHLYFSKKVYESTIRSYRSWCSRTGHAQSYVSQATFRRNFANGFAAEVTDRLYRMRRESAKEYNETHESDSMAIAVRDIKVVIQEMMYEEWPDLRPHPRDCDCDACHRCQDPKCQRPRCVAARKPLRLRKTKQEKIDHAAVQAGRAAGSQVNLSNKPSNRIGAERSGLPSGKE